MEFQLGYKSTVDFRLSYENKKVFGRIDIKLLVKKTIDVVINADQPIGDLRPLWTSTGFSPEEARSHNKNVSDILSRMDTFLNLKLIGSLPIGAMQQVKSTQYKKRAPNALRFTN